MSLVRILNRFNPNRLGPGILTRDICTGIRKVSSCPPSKRKRQRTAANLFGVEPVSETFSQARLPGVFLIQSLSSVLRTKLWSLDRTGTSEIYLIPIWSGLSRHCTYQSYQSCVWFLVSWIQEAWRYMSRTYLKYFNPLIPILINVIT